MSSVLVRAQKNEPAPKRARKRKGTRDPKAPLWELLPDELVRRIVGFVRQRFMIGVYPSPVMGTRVMRSFKSMRLANRALSDGLRTVALLSVPTYHTKHVSRFAEGLVRLACDLFDQAQQAELGSAHVTFKDNWPEDTLGAHADHLPALRAIVKRGWYQSKPQIWYADYQRAVGKHLRTLLPTREIVLPASQFDKRRVANFLMDVVGARGEKSRGEDGGYIRDNLLAAMAVGEWGL